MLHLYAEFCGQRILPGETVTVDGWTITLWMPREAEAMRLACWLEDDPE